MKRRLCAAILTLEAIVLGLTAPVLISVEGVSPGKALGLGLGLAVLCLLTAGMLRMSWAYAVGWLIQVAAIVLGAGVTVMYVLGAIFLVLWFFAVTLGERIDAHQRLAAVRGAELAAAEPEPEPAPDPGWQYELVCGPETWRPHARTAFRSVWSRSAVLWSGVVLALALVCLVAVPSGGALAVVLVVGVVGFPAITWLAQRNAWRTFLGQGREYRTAFTSEAIEVETDQGRFSVAWHEVSELSSARGLVSATLAERGVRLELPGGGLPAGGGRPGPCPHRPPGPLGCLS